MVVGNILPNQNNDPKRETLHFTITGATSVATRVDGCSGATRVHGATRADRHPG